MNKKLTNVLRTNVTLYFICLVLFALAAIPFDVRLAIGEGAAAVLLLWGWQGMNAKADDYTGNWTVDRTGLKNCHIMLSTMIDSKMYDCFSIYPGDDSYNGKEYWFLTAPKVVYSTDDVNEIEASATYDSVQQCYYYRLPNHGTGKIVMTGEAVNLEFHSSLSEPAQSVSYTHLRAHET